MVGAVFSEISLVGLFIWKNRISAKTKMLDYVGNLVEVRTFSKTHTAAELNFNVHNRGAGDVNKKSPRAIL